MTLLRVLSRSARVLSVLFVAAASARASTWVVDTNGGPGVDFTDLPAAVAGSLPGDVFIVRPGVYSGFTLGSKRVILADPGAVVGSQVLLDALPLNTAIAIVGLEFSDPLQDDLVVHNCAGTVVLDGVRIASGTLIIDGSGDVRARNAYVHAPDGGNHVHTTSVQGVPAIRVINGRLEIEGSTVVGGAGNGCVPCQEDGGLGTNGGAGILVTGTGDVHVAHSTVTGGKGGDVTPPCTVCGAYGGNGAPGIQVGTGSDSARALISGFASDVIQGGAGGSVPPAPMGLNQPGVPGDGMAIADFAQVRESAVTFQPGGAGAQPIAQQPSAYLEIASPDDPTMRVAQAPIVGSQITYEIHAPPGAWVDLHIARRGRVIDVPGLEEDVLTFTPRVFGVGYVPASGMITKTLSLPASLGIGPGLILYGQAWVANGTTVSRTNSVPLAVR